MIISGSRFGRWLAALACAAVTALSIPVAAQQPLPPKLSTHALDTYTGKQAAGIRIDLYAIEGEQRKLIKTVRANDEGRVTENLLNGDEMKVGRYELVFHVAEYYKKIGAKLPGGYHTKLTMEFDVYDPQQPHHIPFQITPWTQSASVLPG